MCDISVDARNLWNGTTANLHCPALHHVQTQYFPTASAAVPLRAYATTTTTTTTSTAAAMHAA
jgi:hypothetical protein